MVLDLVTNTVGNVVDLAGSLLTPAPTSPPTSAPSPVTTAPITAPTTAPPVATTTTPAPATAAPPTIRTPTTTSVQITTSPPTGGTTTSTPSSPTVTSSAPTNPVATGGSTSTSTSTTTGAASSSAAASLSALSPTGSAPSAAATGTAPTVITLIPGSTLAPGVTVAPGVTLAPGTTIQPGMTLAPGITLGPDMMLSTGPMLTSDSAPTPVLSDGSSNGTAPLVITPQVPSDAKEDAALFSSESFTAMGCGVLLVLLISVFVIRRRHNHRADKVPIPVTPCEQTHTSIPGTTVLKDTTLSYRGLLSTREMARYPTLLIFSPESEDPEIAAMRIPMEKLEIGEAISRGSFGEVYRGTYNGETVAVKRLLDERRKDIRQIDAFLAEAKRMSGLEHERIVRFIGIAWDALTDVCVVTEFMEGGDLRSTLTQWEVDDRRPHGFDQDKTKIAVHVAHALTYLHSLDPIVVHRDLKSRNILLTRSGDAKITDFGVSRECEEGTMTAGVGSSLWMAPEVMMGERYDEKADVFSFGVVLSELDTHQMPYSHLKGSTSGTKLSELAILQLVSQGRLTAEFSDDANAEMVALARDCLQLDPRNRPTASDLLFRTHKILSSGDANSHSRSHYSL